MNGYSTFVLLCKGVLGGNRVLLSLRRDDQYDTMLLSAEMAVQLRDDLITACQKFDNSPPLTITQQHNPDGSITLLYGWRREEDTL